MKTLVLTAKDKFGFEKATKCWICEKDLSASGIEGDLKVRDRCDYSGKFRGAVDNECNSLFGKPKSVPVIFHNISGYDAHLFAKAWEMGMTQAERLTVYQILKRNTFLSLKVFMKMKMEKRNSNTKFVLLTVSSLCQQVLTNL